METSTLLYKHNSIIKLNPQQFLIISTHNQWKELTNLFRLFFFSFRQWSNHSFVILSQFCHILLSLWMKLVISEFLMSIYFSFPMKFFDLFYRALVCASVVRFNCWSMSSAQMVPYDKNTKVEAELILVQGGSKSCWSMSSIQIFVRTL